MKTTIIIVILSVASSYSRNVEEPAATHYDTLQWWITPTQIFRIKTFALDSDLHVHTIKPDATRDFVKIASENNQKHYGDITIRSVQIEIAGDLQAQDWRKILAAHKLSGRFETSTDKKIPFWNPDGRSYNTTTAPQE
ncbi:MAG: hypothetical protein JNM27_18045 [Leptospirales bacterium]|nr:hypothetical protein [Leptospirales bacterium]